MTERKSFHLAAFFFAAGLVVGFAAAFIVIPHTRVYEIHTTPGLVIKTDSLTQVVNRQF